MDDVPEDIREKANGMADRWVSRGHHDNAALAEDFAQALLSERLAQKEQDAKVTADLVDALKETLEIASRNEAGPYIRRALDALAKATDA